MRNSSEGKGPPSPLLQVAWTTKSGGRTRTCSVTVGTSAIAIALILIGSQAWSLQDVIAMMTKIVPLH
jgi:ribonuclease PH